MNTTVRVLEGIPAAPGMALGRAFILRTPLETVPRYSIAPSALPGELERFRRAIQTSREQMESLLTGVELDDELRAIFEAQLMVLEDPLLIDQTRERISDRQINAEQALAVEINSISEFLLKSKEAIFRERVADLEDIGNRLLSNLMDVPGGDIRAEQIRKLPPDAILVADDISPSLMLHIRFVGGIAVESGGVTGHMAILSRSRGIPCVVGVRDLLNTVSDGMDILLDAENGRLCLQPGEAERRQYAGYLKTRRREATRTITSPVNTACGQSIALWTNLSDVDETTDDRIQGASGVGLFRTEFLYLKNRKLFNDYTGQKNIYGQIFQNLHGQTVTFRLLDVGGDKRLPASANVHQRQLRGIRFLLANRWLLESQLRAIYEAALDAEIGDGICRLMVPMVSTVEEMEAVRHSFDTVRSQVHQERAMASIEQAPVIPLGMMVETPAAVLMCDAFAQRVDFYSIGTNDLAELVLGLARDTSLPPEELYYQPALFRMLSRLVCATSLPVTVCGEIGARLDLLPVLMGLGIRQFSMPPASLYKCAMAIPDLEIAACEALCAKVLQANSVGELRALLDENK